MKNDNEKGEKIMEKVTMTVLEMAQSLGIGRNMAYELIKNGRVPFLKIGRQIRIPKKAFDAWLANEASVDKAVSL